MKTKFFGWPSFGTCNGNISIGGSCLIGRGVFFSAHKECEIEIGDQCSLNTGCHVVAIYGISIGKGTRIGEFCSIRDQNHNSNEISQSVDGQGFSGAPIIIGENCWIGRGVFIGAGVTIGPGTIIGANSVVIKDLPSNCVAAGAPAKIVRYRNSRASA